MNDSKPPHPMHPVIEAQLAQGIAGSVVSFVGYVGPQDGGRSRLFLTLEMDRMLDVPTEKVVYVETLPEAAGLVRMHVHRDAEISLISSRTQATTASIVHDALTQTRPEEAEDTLAATAARRRNDLTDDQVRQCAFDCLIAGKTGVAYLRCVLACEERARRRPPEVSA